MSRWNGEEMALVSASLSYTVLSRASIYFFIFPLLSLSTLRKMSQQTDKVDSDQLLTPRLNSINSVSFLKLLETKA